MANEVRIVVNAEDKASGVFGGIKKNAALGGLAIAGAAAGVGIAATKMAMDFDRGMREVNTLIGLPSEGLQQLKADVLDLFSEMGVAASETVPALYQAISAGVPRENAMDFLRTASKAAIGGVTDLETAVDGITSVVNAYGAEAISAGEASDLMFTAVKLGKTDFSQLSASLFNVIPTASALGVEFGTVTAALARMTAQGTPTLVATTQLRAAMVEALKGGTKLNEAIKDVTGQGFDELMDSGRDMVDVLQEVRESTEESGGKFGDLFGSVEAMNAALALTGDNFEGFTGALDEMGASAGSTDAAFEEMERSAARSWERIKVTLQVGMIRLGEKVLPMVVEALEAFGDWWTEHEDTIQRVIAAIAVAAEGLFRGFESGLEVIMPPLKAFAEYILEHRPLLVIALGAIGLAVGALGVAIVTALGPVSLAVLAITGIVTVIGLAREHWDTILAAMFSAVGYFGDVVTAVFDEAKAKITGVLSWLAQKVQWALDQLNRLKGLATTIRDIAQDPLGALGDALGFGGGGPIQAPTVVPLPNFEPALVPGEPQIRTAASHRSVTVNAHFNGPVTSQRAAEDFVVDAIERARRHGRI